MQGPPATGGSGSSPASSPATGAALGRVARFAADEKLFWRTRRILVGVSGGADSVAALLLLLQLRGRFGFEVDVAHFDHQLRPESPKDLAFVRELCERLEVKCLTGEGDVRALAASRRLGIEDAARRMRYQFLAFAAGKQGADCVATGHTADDQAETVLMRVLRGTGVRGIRGILPVASVPGSPSIRLVRPLLSLTRADTVAICGEGGVNPLVDPSNLDQALARNRVRHDLLATLRAVNPSVDHALRGLAESARELFREVEHQALGTSPSTRGADGSIFALPALVALPNEALTLVIEREAAFTGLAAEVNRTRLRNLRSVLLAGSGRVQFGEVTVQASAGKVRVGAPPEPLPGFEPKVLNVPGVTRAGPWRVEVSTAELPPVEGGRSVAIGATFSGALRARSILPGDRIVLRGLDRAVSDVLVNAKVPRWDRRSLVAIADGRRVLAVVGGSVAFADPASGAEALYIRVSRLEPAVGAIVR